MIRRKQKPNRVDALESKKLERRRASSSKTNLQETFLYNQTPSMQFQICTRGGKINSHGKQHCPVREAVYYKCSKKGHYQSVYKTSKLAQVEVQPEGQEFLSTLVDAWSPVTKKLLSQ